MTSTIHIKMIDKEVEVELSSNVLTQNTIKSQFLLPWNAVVSLSYEIHGRRKGCPMNEAGTAFLLPDNLQEMHFFVDSNKMPSRPASSLSKEAQFSDYDRDRPLSPYVFDEKLADGLRKLLFYVPRAQIALQDPKKTFAKPIEDCLIEGGCVSPISSRAAVTFAHKSHKILREYEEGQNDEINQHSLVEIRNCQDHTIRHMMKVVVVDAHHDFVILHSMDGSEIFKDYPSAKRSPKNFEWFLGFGLSHETQAGQQITHRTGRICSDTVDYKGRYLASSSIDGGDSGGPCYSADRSLIGIMVSSRTTEPRLTKEYDCDITEEEIIDASANPADTWITPGNLFMEAYKIYLIKHGILQARRERELGEPKSKRRAVATL